MNFFGYMTYMSTNCKSACNLICRQNKPLNADVTVTAFYNKHTVICHTWYTHSSHTSHIIFHKNFSLMMQWEYAMCHHLLDLYWLSSLNFIQLLVCQHTCCLKDVLLGHMVWASNLVWTRIFFSYSLSTSQLWRNV